MDGPAGPSGHHQHVLQPEGGGEQRGHVRLDGHSRRESEESSANVSGGEWTSAWVALVCIDDCVVGGHRLLQNYSQAVLQGAPPERVEVARQEKVLEGALLDNYNNRKRGKSLMEVHQSERASGKNKGKKGKKEGGGVEMGLAAQKEEENEWKGHHPWKPWDRENDIAAGRAAVKLDSKEKMAGGLASRFGSGGGGGERQFL